MRQHKLFWGSSYDRGIQHLLKMWPTIKEKFPDATLDICYGWNLFDAGYANNPERMAWKDRINKMMDQPGIVHHGRISKDKLKEVRLLCGIWAYPTHFTEINCITALECQRDGVVPCTMNLAALSETVQSGVRLDGDIYEDDVQKKYLEALLSLMGDEKKWKEEQAKGIKFTKEYDWSIIARRWADNFK